MSKRWRARAAGVALWMAVLPALAGGPPREDHVTVVKVELIARFEGDDGKTYGITEFTWSDGSVSYTTAPILEA